MKDLNRILELRNRCQPLIHCRTLPDSMNLLDVFLNYLFELIEKRPENPPASLADADALMINQMIFTKATHLRKILEGVSFSAANGGKLNPIIDPTIVAAMIRSIYETVCLFHLIYVRPNSEEEKQLVYGLWVSAGLKYRQRFSNQVTTSENQKKQQDELKMIDSLKDQIEDMALYKGLPPKDQDLISRQLQKKEYRVYFVNGSVKVCNSWQEMSKLMGIKQAILGNVYTYFSLYAHPSNVSVMQFQDLFTGDFLSLVNTNLKVCFMLLSSFVADYATVFPKVKEQYSEMGLVEQIVLNFHNTLSRGSEFSINNAMENLG